MLDETANLANLASDLRSLEEGDDSEAESLEYHAGLIENFEALRDNASNVCERIMSVIASSSGVAEDEVDLDGDDERVKIGAFFESIVASAEKYLAALAEGEVDDATAAADLATISFDFDNGVAAMKQVAAVAE